MLIISHLQEFAKPMYVRRHPLSNVIRFGNFDLEVHATKDVQFQNSNRAPHQLPQAGIFKVCYALD